LFKIKDHCNIFQIALRVIASRLVATFLKLLTGLQVATAHSYAAAAFLLHQAAGNDTESYLENVAVNLYFKPSC